MKCYYCEVDLNDSNKSIEHIFINAIGGRLKSDKLLCRTCNNDLGNLLDSELAKQCNFFMNFLLLDREKGSYQKVIGKTSSGEEFILNGIELKSKANFSIERNGDNMNVSFSGSEEKELKKYFKQLSKKYPQVKVDEVLEKANHSKFYLNEPVSINLNIGGDIVMRAVAKIATNYYISNNGKRCYIESIINYIKNGDKGEYVGYYYGLENNKLKVSNNNIYHYINLVGDSKEECLYCYIELFGALKFFVVLSLNYKGKEMNYEYCYNLISKEEVKINMELNLDKDYMKRVLKREYVDIKNINDELNKIIKIGHKRQDQEHLSKLIREASLKTLGKYDEGTPVTEIMLEEFINEVSNSIAIYMTKNNHNKKRTYFK